MPHPPECPGCDEPLYSTFVDRDFTGRPVREACLVCDYRLDGSDELAELDALAEEHAAEEAFDALAADLADPGLPHPGYA